MAADYKMTRLQAKWAAIDAGVRTWKAKGIEYGHCFVCQQETSTHDDAAYPFERCASCHRVVCSDHRQYINNAPVCVGCEAKRQ